MLKKLQQPRGLTARPFLLVSDALALGGSFSLSYLLLPHYRPYLRADPIPLPGLEVQVWLLLLIFPLWYLLLAGSGLYARTSFLWGFLLRRLVRVQLLGLTGLSLLIFALKLQDVSRLLVFGFCALSAPATLVARWLTLTALEAHRSHIYNIPRLLVIGSRERAKEFIREVRRAEEVRCEVVACAEPDPTLAVGSVEGVPIIGTTDVVRRYLFQQPVDIAVIAMPLPLVPDVQRLIDSALELGLRVAVMPDFYVQRAGYDWADAQLDLETFLGLPMAVFSTLSRRSVYRVSKRIVDLVGSALLLVLLAPLFLLIAAFIKLGADKGPVFYRWKVVGFNKRPFLSYKFRTMVAGADSLKPQLAAANEMQGPVFKIRGDPRVTRLGRFLRKYSLDELPQLYSVLKGDMSLVGPRPPFQEEADRFEPWHRRKLSVKPGITCLWQVNGRSQIKSFDDWARLDLEYIQNASLWLDFKILLKTLPAVLRGRGAY